MRSQDRETEIDVRCRFEATCRVVVTEGERAQILANESCLSDWPENAVEQLDTSGAELVDWEVVS